MRKLSFLGLIILFTSFISWSGRDEQIEDQVDFDYKTFVFMKEDIPLIDSIFNFSYEVRGNISSFSFREDYDKSLKEKLFRVSLRSDTIYRISLSKDSCLNSEKINVNSIDSNVVKKIILNALYYNKLLKKINCVQVSKPRIGFGLMYFPNKNTEPDDDMVFLEKNWYYDCSRWKGSERKYLLKLIDRKFGTHVSK
ncbi:MAG: hypothetical protein ACK5Z2_01170 [Bacteroidota bacterium]|jgi:hypothetical protein